ncbi:ExbD/TolR family protein [Gimesia aquarii]|uniref:Biopolymer transport protein ExbD n=1 Tax=Gimesia aquarii TaxID=2527964 RepID=A0A517WY00_9PLAN|nr:biopolymer transporter ExbD [Gimesia aquarii]QDT96566.1 Biopolymer transport protein ExbD [Gimesia aquarii]QDU10139.1 Biopolymer transport protein ExbD [Gimesia aquarii]
MKIPTRPRQPGIRFNITPLIDIVFLLIVFFLAATHLTQNDNLEAVELPLASQNKTEPEEPPRRIIVTITLDEQLHVRGKEISPEELDAKLLSIDDTKRKETEVRIRGDHRIPYRIVERVLIGCARAGISNVQFAVLNE